MAGVVAKKKIPAATLMETMISMVILLVVFGVAMMVYLQVSGSNYNELKAKSYLALQHIKIKTIKSKRLTEESYEMEGYKVYKSIEPYQESLYLIRLEAIRNDGKKLCELKEVMMFDE